MKGSEGKLKLSRRRLAVLLAVVGCFFMFSAAGAAPAAEPATDIPLNITTKSTSLVPGEPARYILVLEAEQAIDMPLGTVIKVDFPKQAKLHKDDVESADPGCTLANVQFKNSNADKYSVLRGPVEVNANTFTLTVENASGTVNAGVKAYLVIPGVINKVPKDGGGLNNKITVTITNPDGQIYTGVDQSTLGYAPATAPAGLTVNATGSSQVDASWSAVEGATRYQLLYSCEKDGTYILACDSSSEPETPDTMWDITETAYIFTAEGNGGLEGGNTYYFKVSAGNEYGYGPKSDAVAVETPVVKPVSYNPTRWANGVPVDAQISVVLNHTVNVPVKKWVTLSEQAGDEPVDMTVTANGNTVNIIPAAPLQTGTVYQVVIYDKALTKTGNELVYNKSFTWRFKTAGEPPAASATPLTVYDLRDVDSNKTWTVKFNRPVDHTTLNANIMVSREAIVKIPLSVELIQAQQDTVLVEPPAGGYQPGVYLLEISKNIKATDGSPLAKAVMLPFIIAGEGM